MEVLILLIWVISLTCDISSYYSIEAFVNILASKPNSFNIMSLNTQSLNAKFERIFISQELLLIHNVELSAICLQETWIDQNTDLSLYQLQNYNCISLSKSVSAHGGLVIYLHKKYTFNIIQKNINSNLWEGQIIDIPASKFNKHIVLMNLYRPPKDNNSIENIETFVNELSPILEALSN